MTSQRLCSLVFLATAAACGSSASIDKSQLIAQLAATVCTKELACCSATPGAPTQAACVTGETSQAQAALMATLNDPLINYNGGAAASCLAALNNESCTALEFYGTSACEGVFSGTVANGGACTSGPECSSGICINIMLDGVTVAAPGKCIAQFQSGQSCVTTGGGELNGELCVSGSYPDYDGSGACVCTPTQSNGTACTYAEQCSSDNCDGTTNQCDTPADSSSLPTETCQEIYSSITGT